MEVTLEVWEAANGRRLLRLDDSAYEPVAFHPKRAEVLIARGDKHVLAWDLDAGREASEFTLPGNPIHLAFSSDGKQCAAVYRAGSDWAITTYDLATGKAGSSARFEYGVSVFDWHPHDRWLAVPDSLGDVHLMEIATGNTRVLGRHKSAAVKVVFSPDGDFLFSGGEENELICWDLRSMRRAFTVGLQCSRLQFRADGLECALFTDTAVQWHRFERPNTFREFNAELLVRLSHATFSPDARWLVAAGRKHLGLWDWQGDESPAWIPGPERATPFFTADGSEIFAYWNDAIGRWGMAPSKKTGEELLLELLPVQKQHRLYSAFVCSNELVLTGGVGLEFIALTNLMAGTGRLYETPAGFGCASPDNRHLVLRSQWEPTIWAYTAPALQWQATIRTGADVMNFAFSPRSDELAVATRAGVEFYDPTTWQHTRWLPMRTSEEANVIFAPDGQTVWVCNDARTASLYDVPSLELLLPLPTGTLPLALTSDGRHLAVSVDARRLQVWDLPELRRSFRELGVDWDDRR